MRRQSKRYCVECGEELTPNSAVYDDYGTPRWYCYNEDCPNYWLNE